jgi:chaperone required for assembly of F1-ATPase
MRDIFTEIFAGEAANPMEAARRSMRSRLRRRFYARSQIGEAAAGYPVLLDGKPVRTPARRALTTPARALSQAIADEWEAQREVIDPAAMPLTRLANAIIDGVAAVPQAVAAEIEKYLGADLVLYRAAGPEGLRVRQDEHWNPVVDWANAELGARFVLTEGVMHTPQPPAAIAAASKAIPRDAPNDIWRLGAVHSIATLTGSGLLALALARGKLSIDAAWAAAHVDEDFQMEQWGRDQLVLERRAFRFTEMAAAAQVLALLDMVIPGPERSEGARKP